MDNATIQQDGFRICEQKFGKLALKCVKCTENETKDGFVLTLKHERVEETKTPFGLKKTPVSLTFYMKVSEACAEGFEAVMNIDDFNIKEYAYVVEDEETGEEVTLWLKWLHAKV
jgi:hypothetical protein